MAEKKTKKTQIEKDQEKEIKQEEILEEVEGEAVEEGDAPSMQEKDVPTDAIKVNEMLLKLESEKDEYVNALKRERADFDNYKKRNAELASSSYANGSADVLTSMINVLDNFERAMAVESTDKSFYDGMNMIMRQLLDVFSNYGVEEIDTSGQFDPNLHNAVVQVEEEGKQSNQIAEVLQKGYKLKDKILRHAMVKVYK